jgi:hypothetical protein
MEDNYVQEIRMKSSPLPISDSCCSLAHKLLNSGPPDIYHSGAALQRSGTAVQWRYGVMALQSGSVEAR